MWNHESPSRDARGRQRTTGLGAPLGPTAACVLALLSGALASCGGTPDAGTLDIAPLEIDAPAGPLLKALSPEESGITTGNTLRQENQIKYIYNGAGVASADVDGDGLPDLYVVSEEGPNHLYRSLGGMHFEDITAGAGVAGPDQEGAYSMGAQFADVDGDGDPDLFVTNWRTGNQLFRNDGHGVFEDTTAAAGVGYSGGATTPAFGDVDRDGDLDLFIATYRPIALQYEQTSVRLQRRNGRIVVPDELKDRMDFVGGRLRELGEKDHLYANRGDGTFEDISDAAGITGSDWGLSSVFADFDGDLWPDLYVTDDFWSPDRFYRNQRDGTFELVPIETVQYTPMFAMGIDAGDIDNDGRLDYFIGDMLSRDHRRFMTQHGMVEDVPMGDPMSRVAPQVGHNGLYRNNGNGSFSDVSWFAGVAASEWTWTVKFVDLDLDGLQDLLITNGMVRDMMDSDFTQRTKELKDVADRKTILDFLHQYPPLVTRNLVFRNRGGLRFEDVSAEWGFNAEAIDYGATVADFDGDGDPDAVVNGINTPAVAYRNDAAAHRVAVRLKGRKSNSDGIGARITVTTTAGTQTQEMKVSGGYLSGHAPEVYFGLGDSTADLTGLRVEWPSGRVQEFPSAAVPGLPVDSLYTITEPSGASVLATPTAGPPPQFQEVAAASGVDFRHVESDFDDFGRQPLLPRRLSTLGPGVSWADADGDGEVDLTFAGAAGQGGQTYHNRGDGSFEALAPEDPGAGEEMAPVWWTPRPGAAPELMVSVSTVEASAPGLRISGAATDLDLGDEATWGPMALADVDGDGDLDVFLGARAKSGAWPLAAGSRLLKNRDGHLADVTDVQAPELANLGLATGALWSDVDGDADPDLVVATEWGPVHLFTNDAGHLTEVTAQAGLADLTGLWNGVTSGDFNGDGAMDLVASNLGLNTKYTATAEHPAVLFAGDLDGNGSLDLVEAYYEGDTLVPFRDRGAAGAAMPFVLDAFDTFGGYASASLAEIYGPRLEKAQRLEATTLAHTLFTNDGAGRFRATPLPDEAQLAIGFGLAVTDLDLDGNDDVYTVGNFRGADPETGPYGAGVSAWLRGDGNGTFTSVPVAASGLFAPVEARGVAVADYDSDGWPDLAVAVNDGPAMLFHNRGVAGRHGLRVRLEGPAANPTAVGGIVTVVRAGGATATREIHAGSGYLSQDDTTLLFGLGDDSDPVTVRVRWPDGTTDERLAVPADQLLVLTHGG